MKKIFSLSLCVIILFSAVFIVLPSLASALEISNTSVYSFAEDLSELYAEENEAGKTLEESAKSRVIVSALRKPDIYGKGDFISNYNGLYVYQYRTNNEAQLAVKYYNTLSYVNFAELDGIVESCSVSYGNPMLQSDDAKQYITNSEYMENEVTIAVLDTGASFTSPNLYGRVEDSGVNFSSTGTENSSKADNIHGTLVSAIIVDNTPDNIKIIAIKVLNSQGSGSNSSILLGLEEAIKRNVDIINMSLATTEYSEAIHNTIKKAYSQGIIITCAAGNSHEDTSKYYPALFDEVYTVGSIDKNGNPSPFTNFGEEVDFVATGNLIEATSSKKRSGTSFASPFIAAASACVLSVNPDFTPDEVKTVLAESCVPAEDLYYHDGFHVVWDYNYHSSEETLALAGGRMIDSIDDYKLYYGYGMPQIANAIIIASEAIPSPEISVESGTYNEGFTIEITISGNYEIYYTSNESYPTKENGILYSGAITVTDSQSFRAVAYSSDGRRSLPITREYKMEYFADEADFTIDSSGYITGYTGELKELIVPDAIDGILVTGVADEAFCESEIISITFPETMEYIGVEAFNGSSINIINAPGLKKIDESGVAYSKLFYLNAPEIEYIEVYGLSNTDLRTVEFNKLTYAGEGAFYSCRCLNSVSLPKLKDMSTSFFAECRMLRTVMLESAETVDTGAFEECWWLNKLYVPNLKYITDNGLSEYQSTFHGCTSLKYVEFPSLISAVYLPYWGNNTKLVLSSNFTQCTATESYNFTVYGTQNTYSETYATQQKSDFIPVPAVINNLPSSFSKEALSVKVAGFNKTYQWYGTNNINSIGTPIPGATEEKFTPDNTYRYYYCVVTSKDGDYPAETTQTSLAENLNYVIPESEKYNASIKIQTPETRYLEYGESVTLYATSTGLPEEAKIKWCIADGTGVNLSPSYNGKCCEVTSKSNGNVIIEAYAVDKQGNTIYNENGKRVYDREGISSEVTLWMIIVDYLKKIFPFIRTAFNNLI